MRTYSTAGTRNLLSTSADEPFLILLEIDHEDLPEPARIVNDLENVVAKGDEYIALPFTITLLDDVDQQIPQATLRIDNVGRELTQWLEYSNGGRGATCRVIQCLRSDPDHFDYDITLDMVEMSIDNFAISARLGFQNTLAQPAVGLRFDPKTAPGLW